MALPLDLMVVEDFLQFIGVFVSFSIAYVALRGVRQTHSASLLRLATAFVLLGFGFAVEGVVGLNLVIPALTFSAMAVVAGLLLETMGYFFLAFSHAIDVVTSKRINAVLLLFPVVMLTGGQLQSVLSILSFYFVLYGVVETGYSYVKSRKPDTLLIAAGLAMIGLGTFVQWLSLLYLNVDVLSLLQIIMKEIGLLILFTPVLRFAVGGVRLDGAV